MVAEFLSLGIATMELSWTAMSPICLIRSKVMRCSNPNVCKNWVLIRSRFADKMPWIK